MSIVATIAADNSFVATITAENSLDVTIAADNSLSTSLSQQGWGANVVTNGGFDADSDWTKGAGWTITSGKAVATVSIADTYQGCLAVGTTYRITYTISDYSGGSIRVRAGGGTLGATRSANGTYTEDLTCTTNIYLILDPITSFTGKIDNVSARPFTTESTSLSASMAADTPLTGSIITKSRPIPVTVKSDGSGDYTTIAAALAGITDNAHNNKYAIYIYEEFQEINLQWKPHVHLIGDSKDMAKVTGYLDISGYGTLEEVPLYHTIETFGYDGIIFRNVTVTNENSKYPVHIDGNANNSNNETRNLSFCNCSFIHKGGAECFAKFGALRWTNTDGLGIGFCSNNIITVDNCLCESQDTNDANGEWAQGIAVHSNAASVLPSIINIKNTECKVTASNNNAFHFYGYYDNGDTVNFQNVTFTNGIAKKYGIQPTTDTLVDGNGQWIYL